MNMIVPSASMALVEHLPVSVIIIDAELNVIHTNLLAGRFLTSQTALQVTDGRLCSETPAKTKHLQAQVWKACSDPEGKRSVVVTSLSDQASLRDLILRIFPIDENWIGLDRQMHGIPIVAVMVEFGQISDAGAKGLVSTFGLSRSEFEILQMLAQGLPPKEIARKRGSEVATVRVHIRNLRAKMDCRTDNEAIIFFNRFARF